MTRTLNFVTLRSEQRMRFISVSRALSLLMGGLLVGLWSGLMPQAQAQQPAVTSPAMPAATPGVSQATSAATAPAASGLANPNAVNAERLIEMLELEKTTNAALADMVASLNRQMQPLGSALKARGVDPAPTIREIEAVVKRFQARVNWAQLKPSLNQIMQDTYTPEQLQAVVDFMNSPLMQGLPAKMAQANKKTEELIRGQVSQLSADIQRVVNKATTKAVRAPAAAGLSGLAQP